MTLVHVLETLLSPPLSRATSEMRLHMRKALERRGWQVSLRVPCGDPLHALLAEARRAHAEVLALGARGATGLRGVLLGGVSSGALNQSPVPVLIAR